MSIRCLIRSGARAGQSATLSKAYITIGSHPQADLRFDAESELIVSARHAAIVARDQRYLIRDLGSTHGTFVNGKRIMGDRLLADNDVVEFGRPGPAIVVTLVPAQLLLPMDERGPAPVAAYREPRYRPTPITGFTAAGIEQTALRRERLVRRNIAVAVIAALVLAGGLTWRYAASGTRAAQQLLRRPLDSTTALRAPGAGAAIDIGRVTRENRGAVGLVVARFGDGASFTGTGFVIRTNRRSAIVVTSRHLVEDAGGSASKRISLILDGSSEALPAEVMRVHPTADLALLRVTTAHALAVVHRLAPAAQSAAEGDGVAILGFPLGLDLPMGGDWRRVGVSATSSAGNVTRVLPTLVQVDGYGAQGSSGSPIFDAAGDVVAVLYGSERESAGRIVYGVPASQVAELLRGMPASP